MAAINYCKENDLSYSPVEMLSLLQSLVVQGRSLEIDSEQIPLSTTGGGCMTNQVYIDRQNVLWIK